MLTPNVIPDVYLISVLGQYGDEAIQPYLVDNNQNFTQAWQRGDCYQISELAVDPSNTTCAAAPVYGIESTYFEYGSY